MIIKVLGPGCARCQNLEKVVREVVRSLKLDVRVEDVRDMKQIMQYSILATPALVIDEKVVMSGKVPTKKEVEQLITGAIADDKQE